MSSYDTTTAAASATSGVDLFNGEVWARQPQNRVVVGFGIAGSAAALDTEVELYIDEVRISNFFNQTTGGVLVNEDMIRLDRLYIPGSAQIRCLIRDAAASNPIQTRIELQDI